MKTIPTQVLLILAFFVPFARASIESANPKDLRPVPVIDIHTHLFNSHDLPLEGIIGTYHIPRPIAAAIAGRLNAATKAEPATSKVNEILSQPIWLDFKSQAKSTESPDIELIRDFVDSNSGDGTAPSQGLPGDVPLKLKSIDKEGFSASELAATTGYSTEFILIAKALQKANFEPEDRDIPDEPTSGKSKRDGKASLAGYLNFISLMTSSRTTIAKKLEGLYSSDDLFVHHMMDMERAYSTKPLVDFGTQNKVFSILDQELEDKFVHFTAFDPFRRKDALAFVQQGVRDGALGVKFYPPSGYRPAENIIPKKPSLISKPLAVFARERWNSRYEGFTDGKELDAYNEMFFDWAESNKVPIFVHCTPYGFQAAKGYGLLMGHPKYWEKVLNAHKNLILCFGHAGGGFYWFNGLKESVEDPDETPDGRSKRLALEAERIEFGAGVVDLCRRFANVYCEVAYLEEVLLPDAKGEQALKTALTSAFHPEKVTPYNLGDKIMYGTDWHQLDKVSGREKYLEAFNRVISSIDQGIWQRKFFSGNAVDFLRLRDRLALATGYRETQRTRWEKIIAAAK